MLYMALAATDKIEYSKAGPAGPARFEAGVAGYEARAFRGLGVFTSSPYEVNDDTDSLQMLQRSTQVGEFYRMSFPKTGDVAGKKAAMDIIIYDEEMDMHVHITFGEAVKASFLYDDSQPEWRLKLATGGKLDDAAAQKAFNEAKTDAAKSAAITGGISIPAGSSMTGVLDGFITKAEKGENPGIEVVIARPFIEHLMMSAVMTVAGRDTGATLFGPAGVFLAFYLFVMHFDADSRVFLLYRHADLCQHLGEDD